MGFLKTVKSDNGLDAPNAYHRIHGISGTQGRIDFTLRAYPSVNFVRENPNSVPLFSKNYNFTPDVSDNAKNMFKQSYEYLFSLEEYKDVTDILEDGQIPL